ncbi:MAG: hypothetical protein EBS19_07610, partial [Spirochaetia bacterium]|nr:hypothetical protein [Spirochaetia bacterium]
GNNAFEEYHEWYKKNIFDVVKNNPEHLRQDQEDLPFPKYDVNKYDIGKYFNGLNKEVFEELQKMVIFLFDPRSKVLLEKERSRSKEKDEDEDFVNHTIYFSVLAQSILIAALEGGKFLDRLEEIVSKYSSEQVNLEKMSSDKFENNNDIASIALNFLNRKNYFN